MNIFKIFRIKKRESFFERYKRRVRELAIIYDVKAEPELNF